MGAKDFYRRYRQRASRLDRGTIMIVSVSAAMIGVISTSFAGPEGRQVILWKVLPWIAVAGAPIAAFDAWGAAAFRGRSREGIARASIILAVFWGCAAYAFIR